VIAIVDIVTTEAIETILAIKFKAQRYKKKLKYQKKETQIIASLFYYLQSVIGNM
jgi:hypothetical protein